MLEKHFQTPMADYLLPIKCSFNFSVVNIASHYPSLTFLLMSILYICKKTYILIKDIILEQYTYEDDDPASLEW